MDNGGVHKRGDANPCEDFVQAFAEHSSPLAARSWALASLEICFSSVSGRMRTVTEMLLQQTRFPCRSTFQEMLVNAASDYRPGDC
jgi:hypothetical protein